METVLLVVHLILALLLIVAVLMQRSEGGGLGIGGGGGGGGGGNIGGFMSVRGTANFLTRATAVIAACFMLTSLTLAILAGNRTSPDSILDRPATADSPIPETKEGGVPLSR